MTDRQTYSLDEVKDMLLAQIRSVVDHFAPPATGSHTTHGLYHTLNPGRADRRVGSFVVKLSGPDAGRWNDYATGSRGDILDLCGLAELGDGHTDPKICLRAARAYLGLDTEDPAARRRRAEQARRAAEERRRQAADDRDRRERRRRAAHAMWLEASADLAGTPVAAYLAGRGLHLERLPRPPRVLRYLPRARYQHIDKETGEFVEGEFPTMAAAMTDAAGTFQGVHRTFLQCRDGIWTKAAVPVAKKVLGNAWAHGITVWNGLGPRGGKPGSLPQCPPGTRVYLTEGIEDALSVALLIPEARVVAAVSLGNLRAVRLPGNVTQVTIVADRDEGREERALLDRAVEAHRQAGRSVRIWLPPEGCKDINDALNAAQRSGPGASETREQT
jgi:hypothetical protein